MYKKYFNIDNNKIYLNAASSGILTKKAAIKAKEYIDIISTNGDITIDEYIDIVDETRKNLAKLINTVSENIGFIKSTTDGVYIIKNSFQDIKNIIIYGKSFPCTEIPFMYDKKYKVEVLSNDIELLKKTLNQFDKSIVFIDLVNFLTGRKIELESIIKVVNSHNSIIAIDAIQAIGAIPVNLQELNIDFMFAGSSKWLLGPQGGGFIYINEKHFKRIVNKCSGWLSLNFTEFGNFEKLPEPKNNASAIEGGTKNFISIIMMNANIKTMLEIGIDKIYKYNINNARNLLQQLDRMGMVTQNYNELQTSILSLKCRDSKRLYQYLTDRNVIVSYRDGYVRFSPHFYNTEEEIGNVVKLLKNYRL